MAFNEKKHIESQTAWIKSLSNAQLYEELIDLSGGDGYDGYFSEEGRVTYNLLKQEMELRLADWLAK